MQVIPDSPALALMLLLPFLASWAALHFLVFVPFMAYLAERRQASEGALADAKRLESAVEADLETLRKRLATAREEVAARRAEARGRALKVEAATLAEARTAADARVKEAVARIAGEADSARASLRQSTASLADDIAQQVLGRAVAP
jgi:F0F1-type ATP synthase membrane subunit b/b'